MTPLQGEPARESSRTLYSISLLQHGPGKVSQTNSAWTFWKNDKRKVPDAKCCQDGHRFSLEASLSIQWRYPKLLRLQTDHPLVPVIGRELEGQQRLGPLTCLLRSGSLRLPFHRCNSMFYFQLWLTTSLYTQTNYWVEWFRQMAGCCCQHSHTEPYIIGHNLIQVKKRVLTGLADNPSELS